MLKSALHTSQMIEKQNFLYMGHDNAVAKEFEHTGSCGIPECVGVVEHWEKIYSELGSRPMDDVPAVCLSNIFNAHHDAKNFDRVDTLGDQRKMLESVELTRKKLKEVSDEESVKKYKEVVSGCIYVIMHYFNITTVYACLIDTYHVISMAPMQ